MYIQSFFIYSVRSHHIAVAEQICLRVAGTLITEVTQQHSLLHDCFRGMMTVTFCTGLVVIGEALAHASTYKETRHYKYK